MTLYADDRAPKRIDFPIKLGEVDGADVVSIVCVVRRPNGSYSEWPLAIDSVTATHVNASYALEADGSSLGAAGKFLARAFLRGAGGVPLGDTLASSFTVQPTSVRRPL